MESLQGCFLLAYKRGLADSQDIYIYIYIYTVAAEGGARGARGATVAAK